MMDEIKCGICGLNIQVIKNYMNEDVLKIHTDMYNEVCEGSYEAVS